MCKKVWSFGSIAIGISYMFLEFTGVGSTPAGLMGAIVFAAGVIAMPGESCAK